MRKVYIAFLFTIILQTITVLSCDIIFAGISAEHYGGRTDEELIKKFYPVVVVAVVKNIDESRVNTNKEPPKLLLNITQVIKGKISVDEIEAIWRPFPHDVDWGGSDAEELIKKWEAIPNPPPEIESKWILSGDIDEHGTFEVAPRCRYPFTKEEMELIISILKMR